MKKSIYETIPVILLFAVICGLLWGSAFPCIKLGYKFFHIDAKDTAGQILFAGIRFSLAGIMVIIFNCIKNKKFMYPKTFASVKRTLSLSLFQTILQYIFFYMGLAHTSGVKASIIESSSVFFIIILTCFILKMENMEINKVLGSLIGFGGILILNLSGLELSINSGDLMVMFSAFCGAMSSVLLRKFGNEDDTALLCGYQFFIGGIILIVLAVFGKGKIEYWDTKGVFLLLYLAFISAAAYSLWALLLKYNQASKIGVLGFLNPLFGVLLSALLLGEDAFNMKSLMALILVCLGIFLVYRKKSV
ncbi:Permease of the drug/metabolite transporter (DMT) superfamily [Acetitomaculum ruminis DSM 5522]|uniref:Permease of the drug/metabolite transporter (DMT) superfamily n=1 Tax=Acetitomaculum ruminis DSM 5522 TaxID=1120918 RepID=A0A1I0Y392_9FIRM|nr:DMT family transporter [Acetitomaculum ruminis]SFB06683.1 Permease of the drug/metabolite transporter (DMT) superfamily [Acetitomaculum ruminis DSM 5522]